MVLRRRVRKTYRKKKMPIKTMIRKEISKKIETKDVTYQHNSIGGISFVSVGYGSTSCVSGLFGAITQGTGDGQRVGNALYARGINIRLAFQPGDSTNYLRFLVVQPKGMGTPTQPSSVATFVSNVLSGAGSAVNQWLQPVDTDRWTVLLDKNYFMKFQSLEGNNATTTPTTRFLNKFIKVNRKIQWDRQSIINNDVYVLALSDSAAIPNPGTVAGFVRCYYQDA